MIPTIVSPTREEYIDFQKYWLVLKRRWLPAGLIFASVTGLSFIATLSKEPIYEAEAQILIKTDESSKLVGLEAERGQIDVLSKDSNPVATEAEILRSRPVVEETIAQLDLRNDSGELADYGQIAGELTVKPIIGTDILQVFYQDEDPEQTAIIVNKLIDVYVEEDTRSNRTVAVAAREFIKTQLPKVESTVAKAEADLRQFKVDNKIASLSQEASSNIDGTKSLENEIDSVKAELKGINGKFEQLRRRLNISWEEAVAISSLGRSAIPQLVSQLQQVRIDLVNQRDRFSENAPQIVSLKEREAELVALLEGQIEQIQGDIQRDSLKDKILSISANNSEQNTISEFANLGVERSGLLSKLEALESNLQTRQKNLENLPLLEEQQRELERRVEATQSTYQMLLSRLQETQVAENQNVGNVRVVARAVTPTQPINTSQKKLIILAGGAIGALLGTGFAFLIDFQDRSIKNSKEAEAIFGYPLQGVIPDLGRLARESSAAQIASQQISDPNSNALVAVNAADAKLAARAREAYQMLQANLHFLSTDGERKAIAITSSVAQEGKSQVSAGLAISTAQLGKKVLLIDADLHRPSQHQIFRLPNLDGLNNILRQELEWEEAIQQVMPNLDVLTSGAISENPIPLLRSPTMKTLMQTLSENYDCVIVDTPPLNGIADTIILGGMVDGLLLVVRPGVVDYDSAIAAKKMLINTDQRILGIVANGVELNNEPYAPYAQYDLKTS